MIRNLLLLLCTAFCAVYVSCSSDDDGPASDFGQWKQRNDAYILTIRKKALADKVNWLIFQSCGLSPSATTNTLNDSVYVEIIKTGNGSGCPLSTDSVRVFYTGRLMPNATYPEGLMFDHSGQSSLPEKIFNHDISRPTAMLVSNNVRGFSTALQHMHIGDRWRIYVPYKIGYQGNGSGKVEPYSTLIFEVELVQYARAGHALPQW